MNATVERLLEAYKSPYVDLDRSIEYESRRVDREDQAEKPRNFLEWYLGKYVFLYA